jgi:hypothetical protein
MTPVRGAELGWDGCQGGWSVTGVACLYSFIPLAGDLGDLVLTGHAAMGNGRPPGGLTVTFRGETPPFAARLALGSAGADVPRGAHEVAGRAGLAAPAVPDGGRREGRACGSWRPDGR